MYDYREAMTEDVKQWITDEVNLADWTEDRGGFEQQLNDDLWTADSVTGNGSGSYTFNRVQASLYVLNNMDLLQKAINEFATDPATVGDKFISEDWEWFDVTDIAAALSDRQSCKRPRCSRYTVPVVRCDPYTNKGKL